MGESKDITQEIFEWLCEQHNLRMKAGRVKKFRRVVAMYLVGTKYDEHAHNAPPKKERTYTVYEEFMKNKPEHIACPGFECDNCNPLNDRLCFNVVVRPVVAALTDEQLREIDRCNVYNIKLIDTKK